MSSINHTVIFKIAYPILGVNEYSSPENDDFVRRTSGTASERTSSAQDKRLSITADGIISVPYESRPSSFGAFSGASTALVPTSSEIGANQKQINQLNENISQYLFLF